MGMMMGKETIKVIKMIGMIGGSEVSGAVAYVMLVKNIHDF